MKATSIFFEEDNLYWTRNAFLRSLKSSTSKYKRYNGLPIRYAGGKTLAVGHIFEHFPDNLKTMASPFIGGGAVEIAAARELGIEVFAYDVFDILCNYWDVQLNHPTRLANMLDKYEPTQEQYKTFKNLLRQHWKGEKKITSKIELAMIYWFNHNLSYGPGFLGWMSKIYEDQNRYKRLVDKVRYFECPLLSVRQDSFVDSIPAHNGTFLYCDPPYYLEDGKMFRGIYPQRNFPVHHNGFNHETLCDLLKQHKGGFVLSYNDCETIRSMYKDFDIFEVRWQYTLGQGETRIGKNRIEAGRLTNVKKSHEILIVNHG